MSLANPFAAHVFHLPLHTTFAAMSHVPVDVQIIAGQRVATNAMGLSSALSSQVSRAASHVLSMCDRLKMIGANAIENVAQMIDLQAIGNGADPQFVCEAVRRSIHTTPMEGTVTFAGTTTSPEPTAIRLRSHPSQKSANRFFIHAAIIAGGNTVVKL